jgi:hypothetical protein
MAGPGGPFPGAPYGPPRRGGGNKALGFLIGGVVVFLMLCAGGYVMYLAYTDHDLSTPATAGGMSRDYDTESKSVEAADKLERAISIATDYKVSGFVSAVYGTGDEKYLFVGGTGDHRFKYPEQTFDSALGTAFANPDGVVYNPTSSKMVDAGGDGVGLTTTLNITATRPTTITSTVFLGAWSTRTTFAIVMHIPDTTGKAGTTKLPLSDTVKNIRKDVED